MHNVRKVKTTQDKQREKLEQSIKKATEYVELRELFLNARKSGDYSVETLKLTTKLLNMCTDCYSIWNFRKRILIELDVLSPEGKKDREREEFQWIEGLLVQHPKSYWVWFHRKWLCDRVEQMDWEREISLCNKALDLDIRNFHCWNYRRFVCSRAQVPLSDELRYTLVKIEQNFSNFSAWHLRSHLLQKLHSDHPQHLVKALNEELELVQNAFYTSPEDQSTWFYHRWLIGMQKKYNTQNFDSVLQHEYEKVEELLQEEPNSKWVMMTSVFLLKEMQPDSPKIKERVEILKTLDPPRRNLYQNLMSNQLK